MSYLQEKSSGCHVSNLGTLVCINDMYNSCPKTVFLVSMLGSKNQEEWGTEESEHLTVVTT